MKRWIALMLGIIALAAGFAQLRSMAARDARPAESISDESRAQLDDILQRTATDPKAGGEARQAAAEDRR